MLLLKYTSDLRFSIGFKHFVMYFIAYGVDYSMTTDITMPVAEQSKYDGSGGTAGAHFGTSTLFCKQMLCTRSTRWTPSREPRSAAVTRPSRPIKLYTYLDYLQK